MCMREGGHCDCVQTEYNLAIKENWGGVVYILKLVSYKQVQLQTRFHSHHNPNVHICTLYNVQCTIVQCTMYIHQFLLDFSCRIRRNWHILKGLSQEKVTALANYPFLENVDKT